MKNGHSATSASIVRLRPNPPADVSADLIFDDETLKRLSALQTQCENSLNGPLVDAHSHHFNTPGKMIRAQLAYQSARVHSASMADADRWGFAVELIHNASLIHDDICDSDLLRRGQQSVMAKFGHQTALCLGDALIAHAFGLLCRESIPKAVIAKLASMVRDCSGGQAQEFDARDYPNWSKYCDIAVGKTSSLLAGAVEGGTLFDPAVGENPLLSRCCHQLALVYQILNDTGNVFASIHSKIPSSDYAMVRPNALIVLFRESLNIEERKDFDRAMGENSFDNTDRAMPVKRLWWDRLVNSDIGSALEGRVTSIMSETYSDYEQLPHAIQHIISPLLSHANKAVAKQDFAVETPPKLYPKKQNG